MEPAAAPSPSRIRVEMPFKVLNRKCGFSCACSARKPRRVRELQRLGGTSAFEFQIRMPLMNRYSIDQENRLNVLMSHPLGEAR